ncbi:Putative periplasmic protein (plasmid) [Neorhizobium galegae bv. officinalis bv. officinalis str. HAMBI 1141]|uniref:Putative periplasmic protein n=1 Tax=Neorhizobium galegae bv. officinalis bv. officinalis str. HAMBI 1141 TaxID=1028801 RepID=A0A068THS2_NEOGA|nr:SH3 domain-containing protein [Neorhizobium galegae]CDN57055.1 Putative periplasmic protein [Neorhizobium galegae bv. officinalis bv. officinalis str. HAMBI 1141]
MRLRCRGAYIFLLLGMLGLCDGAEARLSYTSQQTDKGTHYLVVRGAFDLTDNIQDFVTAVRASGATVIFFNSTGGNVKKAMELGRAIRLLKMTTVQLRGDECASACSLAFLGGIERYAQPGSIGVHKSSFADTSGLTVEEAVSTVQQLTAEVMTYIMEMGVDPALLTLALQYDSNDIRYLSGSEMLKLRVAMNFPTAETAQPQQSLMPSPAPSPTLPPAPQAYAPTGNPTVTSLTQPMEAPPEPSLLIPPAQSGRVQHPKGSVTLKAGPAGSSRTITQVANGAAVTILADTEKWFKVSVVGKVGYLHHSWVWVTQFEAAPFGTAFVQVKSFDNLSETRDYIRNSTLPLSAYLATNGWFAITLDRTFTDGQFAARLTDELKQSKAVPDDSMATYGNAFVRKVCCSR